MSSNNSSANLFSGVPMLGTFNGGTNKHNAGAHKLDPLASRIAADAIVASLLLLPNTQAGIAGGYARDLYFGRDPRDIDIMVCNTNCETWDVKALYEIRMILESFGEVEEQLHYNNSGGNTCITYCFKLLSLCIDIVIYNASFGSVREIVDGFDTNINQFIIDPKGQAIYISREPVGTLKLIPYPSFNCDARRLQKSLDIAKEVGW